MHHYAAPSFASILPEYTNLDTEGIKAAFSTGNHVSLRELPDTFSHNAVSIKKAEKARENLRTTMTADQHRKVTTGGLFEVFEYIPSRYSLVDEINKRKRLEGEAALLAVGGSAFVCGTSNVLMKYEPAFVQKSNPLSSVINTGLQHAPDPYDAAQDESIREKWLKDSKILHGSFKPSGCDKAISKVSRALLPQIVETLYKTIKVDWRHVDFSVKTTEDESIAVRFSLTSIGSEKGVVSYMNALNKKGDCIQEYGLKKIVEDWGRRESDGYIYFFFRPPWIKLKGMETYYKLHPEKKKKGSH